MWMYFQYLVPNARWPAVIFSSALCRDRQSPTQGKHYQQWPKQGNSETQKEKSKVPKDRQIVWLVQTLFSYLWLSWGSRFVGLDKEALCTLWEQETLGPRTMGFLCPWDGLPSGSACGLPSDWIPLLLFQDHLIILQTLSCSFKWPQSLLPQ